MQRYISSVGLWVWVFGVGLWWLYGCGFVLAVICGGCGLWVCVSYELLWLRGYGFGCGSALVWVVVGCRHGVDGEEWVWCFKEWISLGSRMVSQKKLLMFEDLGSLWVWEWFQEERFLCLKLWVSRYLWIKFWFSLYLWGFEGVVSFVFVNRNLILSDFDSDWK